MTDSPRPRPVFRRSGEYVARLIAGETIVVPIRAEAASLDSVYVFNEVGAAIWGLLEAGGGADEIARAVARDFDVTAEAAGVDVERFLGLLAGAGLVESRELP